MFAESQILLDGKYPIQGSGREREKLLYIQNESKYVEPGSVSLIFALAFIILHLVNQQGIL